MDGGATAVPTTGHIYRGTVQVTGRGQHVQGDIGIPHKDSSKHIYSGTTTVSDDAKVVSGNITEPGFAARFFG